MIHLLEISPDATPQQVKKLARRFAMTGGVEFALQPDLTTEQLDKIAATFMPEIQTYDGNDTERANSIAVTVVRLLIKAPNISQGTVEMIQSHLGR